MSKKKINSYEERKKQRKRKSTQIINEEIEEITKIKEIQKEQCLREKAEHYYEVALNLKELGDITEEIPHKNTIYTQSESFAILSAQTYLELSIKYPLLIDNAAKVLSLTNNIETWKLETFGVGQYNLNQDLLDIWPKIRKRTSLQP